MPWGRVRVRPLATVRRQGVASLKLLCKLTVAVVIMIMTTTLPFTNTCYNDPQHNGLKEDLPSRQITLDFGYGDPVGCWLKNSV